MLAVKKQEADQPFETFPGAFAETALLAFSYRAARAASMNALIRS